MTEQPVETEQEFLGNQTRTVNIANFARATRHVLDTAAAVPLQHYAPAAHLRRPSWAPGDDVELASLVRKCSNAARLLAIAKAEAVQKEADLQHALSVEDEAMEKLNEAEKALVAFTRKDSGL